MNFSFLRFVSIYGFLKVLKVAFSEYLTLVASEGSNFVTKPIPNALFLECESSLAFSFVLTLGGEILPMEFTSIGDTLDLTYSNFVK